MKKIVKTLIFFLLIITIFFVIAKIIYKDDYIDEIDNEEDYIRVSLEIKDFDYREKEKINVEILLYYN